MICTVRGCGRRLTRARQTYRCEHGHSFDVAREGYVNLLQPQHRRSLSAGDSREAVEARASLLASGIGSRNLAATAAVAAKALLLSGDLPVVVDLGSGSGETLGRLAATRAICGVGLDLSVAAASHAARAMLNDCLTWVVANADLALPLADASVDLVLSIHGRRNPSECRRILVDSGRLVVSVPAADDLIELREHVQGRTAGRQRVDEMIREHEAWFRVIDRLRVSEHHTLGREPLLNLLRGTYRGIRASQSDRVASLAQLTVTLASDVVLFERRR